MVQTSSSVNMSNGAVGHYALTASLMLLDPVIGNLKNKQTKRYTINSLYLKAPNEKKRNCIFLFFPFKTSAPK